MIGMFIDLVRKRKTKRKYSDRRLDKEEMELIMEAGDKAPTSRNLRPVRLVPVTIRDKIKELETCKDSGAEALRTATYAVVVAADPTVSDTWVEDASIAAIFMQLEAEDLDIGSCWIQVHLRSAGDVSAEDNVKRILGLDPKLRVVAIVSFGKV